MSGFSGGGFWGRGFLGARKNYSKLLITPTSPVVDEATGKAVALVGNAAVTADIGPGGAGSYALALDGAGDYLQVADSNDWAWGAQKVTIQGKLYFNNPGVTDACLISQWNGTDGFAVYLTGGQLRFRIAQGGAMQDVQGAFAPAQGQWYDWRVACDATDATHGAGYVFVDNAQIGFSANMKAAAAGNGGPGNITNTVRVGSLEGFPQFDVNGRIAMVNLEVGIARL